MELTPSKMDTTLKAKSWTSEMKSGGLKINQISHSFYE